LFLTTVILEGGDVRKTWGSEFLKGSFNRRGGRGQVRDDRGREVKKLPYLGANCLQNV